MWPFFVLLWNEHFELRSSVEINMWLQHPENVILSEWWCVHSEECWRDTQTPYSWCTPWSVRLSHSSKISTHVTGNFDKNKDGQTGTRVTELIDLREKPDRWKLTCNPRTRRMWFWQNGDAYMARKLRGYSLASTTKTNMYPSARRRPFPKIHHASVSKWDPLRDLYKSSKELFPFFHTIGRAMRPDAERALLETFNSRNREIRSKMKMKKPAPELQSWST